MNTPGNNGKDKTSEHEEDITLRHYFLPLLPCLKCGQLINSLNNPLKYNTFIFALMGNHQNKKGERLELT